MEKNTNVLEKNKMTDVMKKQIEILKNHMLANYKFQDMTKVNTLKLIKYILNAKKENCDDYSDSWKKTSLFAMKAYYISLNKGVRGITNAIDKICKKIKEEEERHEQTKKEKENYLTYDELCTLMKMHKNYKTKIEMNTYLILAAICMNEIAFRPQIMANLEIVYNDKDKDDNKNQLIINTKKKTCRVLINKDKLKYSGVGEIDLSSDYCKEIIESLEKYDRKKLLEYDVKDVEKKMLYELQKACGNKFNFDMARSAVATKWNKENPNATYSQKLEFAKKMRHSVHVQGTHYVKINPVSGNLDKILEEKIKKEKEQKEREKKLIEKNKYYELNKIRAVISMGNKRKEKNSDNCIKEETIAKYNILLNKDGKYHIPKQNNVTKITEKKQLKGLPLDVFNAQFIKKRNDIIRCANKKINDGKVSNIKESTMKFYGIKQNLITKLYEHI
jgi:hypothetical protein